MNSKLKLFACLIIILTSLTNHSAEKTEQNCIELYLAKELFENINKKILTLSEKEMDEIIFKIHLLGISYTMDEKFILETLQKKVKTKVSYYKERKDKKYNHENLRLSLNALGIMMAFLGTVYAFRKTFINSKINEFNSIKKALKEIGVQVTQHTYGDTRELHILVSRKLSISEALFYTESWVRLIDLQKTSSLAEILEITGLVGAFLAGCAGVQNLYQWLCPRHKEHYEQFYSLQRKLDQRIAI